MFNMVRPRLAMTSKNAASRRGVIPYARHFWIERPGTIAKSHLAIQLALTKFAALLQWRL